MSTNDASFRLPPLSGAHPGSPLRLVDNRAPASDAHRRREIERENKRSAQLPDTDARRILAARVSQALEGGPAAILRPERRRKIVSLAHRLGLRPFDANLIIAIVQDGARRNATHDNPDTRATLELVHPPSRAAHPIKAHSPRTRTNAGVAIATAILALSLAAALIAWLNGTI